jgi:uncharacterized protein (TIGR02996 family)
MTSDGDALFRAICEQPWEDTPRLIYADWLDENGDPQRAEFIRVMVELAPQANGGPRRIELRARAKQLHRESHGRWTRGSPTGDGVRIGRELNRGFYNEVTFGGDDVFAQFADTVFAWTPIDTVSIGRLRDGAAPAILTSDYAARLKALRVGDDCGDATCRAVAGCPSLSQLTELVIRGSSTEVGALALARSPYLERVRTLHLNGRTPLPKTVLVDLKGRFDSFRFDS